MRILILTQWFDPEPTSKGLMFARALVEQGHEVEVITGFPNYPGGELYPGYRLRPFRRERHDGVSILRVALYPSHDASGLRRALNYASFAASAALFGSLMTRQADVIYVYHPPLTAGLAGVVLAYLKRAPFVYDIQDLWPDTLAATGMLQSRRALDTVGKIATFVYRRANALVVQSHGFKRVLVERGVPESKIEVIHNWCDEERSGQSPGDEIADVLGGAGEKFNVVFAGTMGKAQGLDAVLQAAKELAADRRIQFVFVGGGVEVAGLVARAKQMVLPNVRFLPRMPMSDVGQVLAAADVLLVHLRDDPLFEITIPSKTQAYMAAGKPILMAVRGDAADLVTVAGCGIVCEPGDARGVADAVVRLAGLPKEELRQMGERGREYYRSHLSLREGTERFVSVFRKAAAEGMRRR